MKISSLEQVYNWNIHNIQSRKHKFSDLFRI